MENNNNGRGIFYGVIGVATLVVAIIGATFAFFSASVVQNNAIANVASTTVDLDFDASETQNLRTDMIPVDTVDKDGEEVTAFYTFPGIDSDTDCIDLNGNSICSVYEFTISNPSENTAQRVTGSLTVTANGTGTKKFTNLKYAVFKGAAADITSWDVNDDAWEADDFVSHGAAAGTLLYAGTVGNVGTTDDWTAINDLLGVSGGGSDSVTYSVLIWLEETGESQNDEMGLPFAASLTFSSPEGSEVSGVLTAAS